MEMNEARKLAHTKMTEHGLIEKGWRFDFDNARRRLGRCQYSTQTITISRHMTGAADEETVLQTAIHEIAHALLGHGHGHGHNNVWKAKAKEIGHIGARLSVNPYSGPGQAAPTVVLPADRPTFVAGQPLMLRNGKIGTILSHGPKRYKVQAMSGIWTVPFAIARLVESADVVTTAVAPVTPVRAPRLAVGTLILFGSGKRGVIEKVATKRYHTRDQQGELWSVPSEMAKELPATELLAA